MKPIVDFTSIKRCRIGLDLLILSPTFLRACKFMNEVFFKSLSRNCCCDQSSKGLLER